MKMSIFRRIFCLVNSHLAAHQDKVAARNADFEYIYSQMAFGSRVGAAAIATASAAKGFLFRARSQMASFYFPSKSCDAFMVLKLLSSCVPLGMMHL